MGALAKGRQHLMTNSAWDEAQAVVLRLSPATILMKLASRLGDVALCGVLAHVCMSTDFVLKTSIASSAYSGSLAVLLQGKHLQALDRLHKMLG